MTRSPNSRLLDCIRHLGPPEAQNRLMRIADRELALSLLYMDERDRRRIFSLIAPAKEHRIREEYGFAAKRSVRYEQYLLAVENVIAQLRRERGVAPLSSYLRPRRRR